MKILIGINTLSTVEQPVYANHLHFFHRLGKNHPEHDFAINTPRRMSIDRMRNMTAKVALENDFDYVMFIDDDVVIPIDAFDKLLATDADIVAGNTIIRGYPFENMFFRYRDGDVNKLEYVKDGEFEPKTVIDVDAVGFSCCLIKCPLIKKLSPPYFVTGSHSTEDIYFCIKAKKYLPETTIKVDTSIETAHVLGPEFISPWNKQSYKKYFEETFPDMIGNDPKINGDRGADFLAKVTAAHEEA